MTCTQASEIHPPTPQPTEAGSNGGGKAHPQNQLVTTRSTGRKRGDTLPIDTEAAQATTRELARYEGILAGPSSGAAVLASLRLAETLDRGVIVTILPDGGNRYLGDSFWHDR